MIISVANFTLLCAVRMKTLSICLQNVTNSSPRHTGSQLQIPSYHQDTTYKVRICTVNSFYSRQISPFQENQEFRGERTKTLFVSYPMTKFDLSRHGKTVQDVESSPITSLIGMENCIIALKLNLRKG